MPTCLCRGEPPLCGFCVDAALTRRLLRAAERIGQRWGLTVYKRKPGGAWPHWDADTTGKLHAAAFWYVRGMHTDPRVIDRLARTCAYHAGVAYREATQRAAGPR